MEKIYLVLISWASSKSIHWSTYDTEGGVLDYARRDDSRVHACQRSEILRIFSVDVDGNTIQLTTVFEDGELRLKPIQD